MTGNQASNTLARGWEFVTTVLESSGSAEIQALSHEEDVAGLSAQMSAHLESRPQATTSFSALVKALDLPSGAIWLALLLGDHSYELRRKNEDFYSESGIEVVRKDAQDSV